MASSSLPAPLTRKAEQGVDSDTGREPGEFSAEKTVSFFTLPIEVRLEIYNLLLVSRFCANDSAPWSQEVGVQKPISPFMLKNLGPHILQTCRRINDEANPILYSHNEFRITGPGETLRFMAQIGPRNVKLLRMLQISVPCYVYGESGTWVALLDALAKDATGLRAVHVEWAAECDFSWEYARGSEERGLGDNLDFVRALAQIRGLEKMAIRGCYAKTWPAYLEEKMGVPVRARCGNVGMLRCVNVDNEESKEEDGPELQRLRNYQQGTEDLIP
ncbi:hypothetical protein QQZ08_008777 [Neonectria magnoliae]|uniref:F-box domain-containing protein n=1 Tax=Neonectria magnoliae TaxID=2732573 RepID=A0ABR1HU83_9HYPO